MYLLGELHGPPPSPSASALEPLRARISETSDEVKEAIRAGDLYLLAHWRLERAMVELELRDLYGPWSREGDRWNAWMRDDIDRAKEAAAQLALRIGDGGLAERLMQPYPRLHGLRAGW